MASATLLAANPEIVHRFSVSEYLEAEHKTGERHFFYNGNIVIMSGGTINHNRLGRNIISLLDQELANNFEVFGSNQKIYLPKYNFYVYPDAVVVAAAPIISNNAAHAIVNPLLIVEVLSNSTANYDKGDKFMQYKTLPSFMEYVLVRQDEPEVSSFFREEPDLWRSTEVAGLENSVFLKSVNVNLPLSRIYKKVF